MTLRITASTERTHHEQKSQYGTKANTLIVRNQWGRQEKLRNKTILNRIYVFRLIIIISRPSDSVYGFEWEHEQASQVPPTSPYACNRIGYDKWNTIFKLSQAPTISKNQCRSTFDWVSVVSLVLNRSFSYTLYNKEEYNYYSFFYRSFSSVSL